MPCISLMLCCSKNHALTLFVHMQRVDLENHSWANYFLAAYKARSNTAHSHWLCKSWAHPFAMHRSWTQPPTVCCRVCLNSWKARAGPRLLLACKLCCTARFQLVGHLAACNLPACSCAIMHPINIMFAAAVCQAALSLAMMRFGPRSLHYPS